MPRASVGPPPLPGLPRLHASSQAQLPECASDNLEWVGSEGRGKVYTFVITRQPVSPAFVGRLPWAVVEVELEEGVHLISNLVDCDPEDIEIGMPVEVVFEAVNNEITLPKFKAISF